MVSKSLPFFPINGHPFKRCLFSDGRRPPTQPVDDLYIFTRMSLQLYIEPKKSMPSLFPVYSPQHHQRLSDEEFHTFHSIDRELYAALVHNLGRDPAESVHIMAFWMWLERRTAATCHMKLIKRMLSLPPAMLNEVANETGACLKCVENDTFGCGGEDGNGYVEIGLLRDLLSNQDISLFFFHQNRIQVLRGVAKIISTVCSRAFNDIMKPMVRQKMEVDQVGEATVVPADDRTVFLTFSKGYPIAEDEVKEFFSRRFGDLIEKLIMQHVGEDEQPLYAKMVVRRPAVVGLIVPGDKAKYCINGKHVWARKYVKRQQTQAQTGESATSKQGHQVTGSPPPPQSSERVS